MNGDITIQADCLMPARLLARALSQGARFESVRIRGERRVILRCDAASARILLALCERFSIPAKVLHRGGGSGLIAYARRRLTLPVGIIVFIALCALFLTRLWRVDVAFSGEAAAQGDCAALQGLLAAEGIVPGMPRQGLDTGLLAKKLTAAGGYSYVGVRLRGVRLAVEAVPEVPSPLLYDVDAPRDLVSDRDGIVVSAVARSGQLCVKPGDAVRRGQTLIRGEELATREETRPIAALGEVVLRGWETGRAALPLLATAQRPTGNSSVSTGLVTPWHDFAITEGERFAQQWEAVSRLPVGGLFLPVELTHTVRREVEIVPLEADREVLRARLSALALSDAAARLSLSGPADYEITDSWVNYEQADGVMRALAVYEIQANAAVTREELQGG